MKWVKIKEIQTQLQTMKNQLNINSGNNVICSGDYTYTELIYKYSNFEFNQIDENSEPAVYFVNLFRSFINTNQNDINKIYEAMNAKYNPIENYNSNEKTIEATATAGDKTTTTPTGIVETENTLQSTTYDSQDLRTTDKNTQKNSYTNYNVEVSNTPNNTLTYTDNDGTEYNNMNEFKIYDNKKSGNIGVTTSQNMIKQELELRKMIWISGIIFKFIKYYCILIGDDE